MDSGKGDLLPDIARDYQRKYQIIGTDKPVLLKVSLPKIGSNFAKITFTYLSE